MNAGAGRPCTICTHPERSEIERAILSGAVIRQIAARSGMSAQSVLRHRDGHMSRSIKAAAAQEHQEVAETHDASLLDQARDLHKKALVLMTEARRAGDLRTALLGVGQAAKLLELQGKFLGQIAPSTINVLISAEFKTVQIALLGALENH